MRPPVHERHSRTVTIEPDEAIWRHVVAGDAAAYGLIWDRHHARVLGHLVRAGHSRHDADDLTAVAFLDGWRRRSSVRFVDGSILPWLVVTARSVSRNAKRARRRYSHFLANLPPADSSPDPLDEIADEDAAARLLRTIAQDMRARDGDLLAMAAIGGFTVQEAAAALGLSEAAAKSRLSRLREKLRLTLGEDLLIEEGHHDQSR